MDGKTGTAGNGMTELDGVAPSMLEDETGSIRASAVAHATVPVPFLISSSYSSEVHSSLVASSDQHIDG